MAEVVTEARNGDAARAGRIGNVFTLELGDDQNSQIRIFALQRTLRGRWSNRNVIVQHNLSTMPDIPVIHLTVNLRESKITISDPLNGDKKLCQRIRAAENQATLTVSTAGRCGIDTVESTLNTDQMKTLLLELNGLVASNSATVIKGQMPEYKQIEEMPGDELLDPHGVTPGMPMYVKDYWKFRGRNMGIPLSGDPAAMKASAAR